jgi:cytochrome c biogenesis protein CcdA/thiol-disulfide isomerase/thioredoxin
MTLFVLSYLAGVLTILAPCILPVLPFVFARADRPFVRSGLPLLAGLALGFSVVATLATLAGTWAEDANEAIRGVALLGLAATGLALLIPKLAVLWSRPLVALAARLGAVAHDAAQTSGRSVLPSLLLGVATGLLWAPCAGPVLGLVLSTAVLQGASARSTLLLLAYATGAATSLALALWAGGRVFAAMKRALGVGEWIRKGLGVAVLAGVAVIGLGLDTALLAALPSNGTDALEQRLLQRWHRMPASSAHGATTTARTYRAAMTANGTARALPAAAPAPDLQVEGHLPELTGATAWLNSEPLTAGALRGKVVLIDFWTFDCINCRNALPYVRAWAEKYKDQGLVVIGVHSPEFAFERKLDNVKRAVRDLGLNFPIAIDNNFTIWRAFDNQYWPAHYFVDAQGRIRFHKFGEGDYERSEQVIRQLLKEARDARGGT